MVIYRYRELSIGEVYGTFKEQVGKFQTAAWNGDLSSTLAYLHCVHVRVTDGLSTYTNIHPYTTHTHTHTHTHNTVTDGLTDYTHTYTHTHTHAE